MKRILLLTLLSLGIVGCKKTSDNPTVDPLVPNNQIIINGHTFSTVDIEDQTWTSVNYYGSVGSGNIGIENGWKYERSQMIDIVAPSGWRIPTKADVEKLFRNAGVNADYIPLIESYGEYLQPDPGTKTDIGIQLRMTSDIAVKFLGGMEWTDVILTNSNGFNAEAFSEKNQNPEWWCSDDGMCTFMFSKDSSNNVIGQLKYLPDIDTNGSKYLYKTCRVRFVKDK